MVSPQREFPAEAGLPPDPPPQLHQDSPAPGKPPGRRGWRSGYSWIILALILGVWYAGFGWGDSGGWIWGHHHAPLPVANGGDQSDSGVVILEVANKQDYIGQTFQIRDVAVDHWSGKRAVWIGSRHSYLPMLMILPSGTSLAPLSAGATSAGNSGAGVTGVSAGANGGTAAAVQQLGVTGKIVKAPPAAQAQQQWKLSDDDVNQLEDEGVYIQATAAQPAKHSTD